MGYKKARAHILHALKPRWRLDRQASAGGGVRTVSHASPSPSRMPERRRSNQ
ncbi:hypothetical protein CEE69_14925 [Rhodopirellula bahusiensis]|uniref:Uncharacterized protein n=1 Tax=Rhodopirellula bahusiensis TaxID=2014065 RepID=A0A2G1W6M5_9BACT|nr:hypothetical protein CEE69_14925 [Rhodopirellula bahusiensis]